MTDIVVGGQSESKGLPGHHGPGVAAGDVDGDGRTEVIFLTKDRTLHVCDGATGREKDDLTHRANRPLKDVLGYPLARRFRELLGELR